MTPNVRHSIAASRLRVIHIPSLEDLNGDNALSLTSRIPRRWTRIDLAQIVEKIYVLWRPSL